MQWVKKNQLLRGGASAHKKGLQSRTRTACLNAVKLGNTKEERCKNISEDKENTGQISENYLELKDRKKIKFVMVHVWKTVSIIRCLFQMDLLEMSQL